MSDDAMPEVCLWCGKVLRFFAGKGWAHADTGELYAGTCYCQAAEPHTRLDQCRTWRDDHPATPDRSQRLPI